MVFQDPMTSLHPMLSIGTQLTEHVRRHLGLRRRARRRARARAALRRFGSRTRRARCTAFPHQFSGGMRQRIAIAIALACRPKLLVADEPTTALDVTVQAGIIRLLDRLRREQGLSIVLITHDLGVLSSIADRVAIFYAGRVVEAGAAPDLLSHPRHPYTRGLLDALPHPESAAQPLVAIQGAPPAPRHVPPGCAFHPRCQRTQRPSCAEAIPPLVPVEAGGAGVPGRSAARTRSPLLSALELRDVVVEYEGAAPVRAVAGASLDVDRGQIVGLVGESGCGKSTLARAAVGMVAAIAGTVRFEGRDVQPLTRGARPHELARLQMVFQNPFSSLNPRRRVGEQIADALATLGLAPRGSGRPHRAAARAGRPSRAAARGYPHQFSGGQRQRIAIARALARTRP